MLSVSDFEKVAKLQERLQLRYWHFITSQGVPALIYLIVGATVPVAIDSPLESLHADHWSAPFLQGNGLLPMLPL